MIDELIGTLKGLLDPGLRIASDKNIDDLKYADDTEEEKLGSTGIGIKTPEGIVLAVEKRVNSPLIVPSSIEKIFKVDDHIGPALRTDDSVRHASVLRAASARHMVPTSSGISRSVLKPRHPLYLAAFNVRTLKQAGQQVVLALTLDSLCIYMCCVSETRIQDASKVTELTAPSVSTRFRLCSSGDPEAAATGCARVGVVLT
ncbi:hypothetical protein T265_11456 [Opisthorchis viverrini]|uniref:Uncharacterized protein n=1 Tax=Opisthorchis viverrini TaxID=6198 RepID=A0A074YYJ6_OPIVI|nr:hypothetical protein T265_11456 [Opisthorchis viverrini]KER19871.1 hypothetical protein T265_11456 [Opisthorchis viverrini]